MAGGMVQGELWSPQPDNPLRLVVIGLHIKAEKGCLTNFLMWFLQRSLVLNLFRPWISGWTIRQHGERIGQDKIMRTEKRPKAKIVINSEKKGEWGWWIQKLRLRPDSKEFGPKLESRMHTKCEEPTGATDGDPLWEEDLREAWPEHAS